MSDVVDASSMNLADERKNYLRGQLRRADLQADPIQQFHRWMQEAHEGNVVEPTAMSLGTAGGDARPRVRTVLLKGLDERGFVFFTNFGSRKGRQLGENPQASLLFPWLALERQVLVIGPVTRTDHEETLAYFHSRPRESQLAAWASQQSDLVTSRDALDAGLDEIRRRFGPQEGEVPPPPFWGGYRVRPDTVEFWQGRANRMHDRFEYTRQPDGSWAMARLSP